MVLRVSFKGSQPLMRRRMKAGQGLRPVDPEEKRKPAMTEFIDVEPEAGLLSDQLFDEAIEAIAIRELECQASWQLHLQQLIDDLEEEPSNATD